MFRKSGGGRLKMTARFYSFSGGQTKFREKVEKANEELKREYQIINCKDNCDIRAQKIKDCIKN
jgi:hypothetical protein